MHAAMVMRGAPEMPMEESDVTGTVLADPTGHWARKPERVTQDAGPAELGYEWEWATLSGAGWSSRLPKEAGVTVAGPDKAGGLG